MSANHTLISISKLNHQQLKDIKEELGKSTISFDLVISQLIINYYKDKIKKDNK